MNWNLHFKLAKISVKSKSIDCLFLLFRIWNPANIYLFKVNNRNNKKRCEILAEIFYVSVKKQNYIYALDGTSSNLNVMKMPGRISLKAIYQNIYLFSYIYHLQVS